MRLFDDFGTTLKALRVFAFGKGFMTLAVLGASMVSTATGIGWVMPVIFAGGVALTAVNRFYRESLYQEQMVDLYRDDIAKHLGIPPQSVGREHLKLAARDNEVIGQALKRQRNLTWLSIGTSVLSGAITWGVINAFGGGNELNATTAIHDTAAKIFGSNVVGGIANFIGIGTISAVVGLIFNTGLREIIEFATPVGKASAHDRIVDLEFQVKRGQPVTKEQVYGVLVAGNPKLQQAIHQKFHEPYAHMNARKQAEVLGQIGVSDEMQTLAGQLNQREIRPGKLAYMLSAAPEATPATRQEAQEETSRGNFVERLGLAPKKENSYRAQIDAERSIERERGMA